jgi:hypothetical protein
MITIAADSRARRRVSGHRTRWIASLGAAVMMAQCITACARASAAPQGMTRPADFVDIPLTTRATWQLDEVNHALLYEVWQSVGFSSANIKVWYRPQGKVLATFVDAIFYSSAAAQEGLAEYWQLLSKGGPATPIALFGLPSGIQVLELLRATSTGQSGQILAVQRDKDVLISVLSGNRIDDMVTSAFADDMKEAAR